MSRNTSKKTASSRTGSPLLVGLLMGLIVGLGMAAGLAWILMKSSTPFISKEQIVVNKPQAVEQLKATASAVVKQKSPIVQPVVSAVSAASGVTEDKPRFEFYKVLTDKSDSAALPNQSVAKAAVTKVVADPNKPKSEAVKVPVESSKPIAITKQTYYLQAGAFLNEAEAEKLKASLIIDGLEVSVMSTTNADNKTLHKVRVGPYQGADEMNSARAKLQLKGISSTPMHGQ